MAVQATITYQWQSSTNGTDWSDIDGATAATYDAPTSASAGTTYYRVVVAAADGGCEDSTSEEAIVVVQEDIAITTQPTGADVCIDGDALLTVSPSSGGSGDITYQWQSSTNGTDWSDIDGATAATYDAPTTAAGTTYYRVVIAAADGGCEDSTSEEAIVVVQEDIAITTQPTGADVCIDGDAIANRYPLQVVQAISLISGSPVQTVQIGQILMALLQLLMMHQPQQQVRLTTE